MQRMDGADARLDVDARFLLANERTLLAWVRTSLTLLAAGTAVAQVGERHAARTALAGLLIALGVGAAVAGAARYRAADRALRRGLLPAADWAPTGLALAVAAVGVLLGAAVLLAGSALGL